jgi:hypothetical protein
LYVNVGSIKNKRKCVGALHVTPSRASDISVAGVWAAKISSHAQPTSSGDKLPV